MNALAPLRRFAGEMSAIIDSDPNSRAATVARRLERSAIAAIVELDKLEFPDPFAQPRELKDAGDRFVWVMANRCNDCGAQLVRTPNAATRVEDGPDGPRCDLLECPDPQCGFAEAVEP
jgi:hypothetical protein